MSFPRRRNSDPVAPWIEALSLIRLGLVEPGEAEARYDGDVDGLAAVVACVPGGTRTSSVPSISTIRSTAPCWSCSPNPMRGALRSGRVV